MCFLRKTCSNALNIVDLLIEFSVVVVLISSFCRFFYLGHLHVIQQKGFQFCIENAMVDLKKRHLHLLATADCQYHVFLDNSNFWIRKFLDWRSVLDRFFCCFLTKITEYLTAIALQLTQPYHGRMWLIDGLAL